MDPAITDPHVESDLARYCEEITEEQGNVRIQLAYVHGNLGESKLKGVR